MSHSCLTSAPCLILWKTEATTILTQGDDDDGDDDREGGSGYVELEDRITDILSATSFTLGSYTVDIKNATKLEIDDRRVSVDEFMAVLQINDIVEVEGTWSSNSVINAYEAELEND